MCNSKTFYRWTLHTYLLCIKLFCMKHDLWNGVSSAYFIFCECGGGRNVNGPCWRQPKRVARPTELTSAIAGRQTTLTDDTGYQLHLLSAWSTNPSLIHLTQIFQHYLPIYLSTLHVKPKTVNRVFVQSQLEIVEPLAYVSNFSLKYLLLFYCILLDWTLNNSFENPCSVDFHKYILVPLRETGSYIDELFVLFQVPPRV